MTENATPSIVHSPAASPSTPSEKLTTFISPTSQITVSTPPVLGNWSAPTNGSVTSVTTAPPSTAITAAAICPTSLTQRRQRALSSIAPTSVIRHGAGQDRPRVDRRPRPAAVRRTWAA